MYRSMQVSSTTTRRTWTDIRIGENLDVLSESICVESVDVMRIWQNANAIASLQRDRHRKKETRQKCGSDLAMTSYQGFATAQD